MSETTCQASPSGAMATRQEPNILRLPPWVVSKIACKPKGFTGQLVVNWFQGGVSNIEWRESQKEHS